MYQGLRRQRRIRDPYQKKHDHNGICDRCGFKFKFSQLKRTWDNLWVCSWDFELRNEQDFLRGFKDEQSPAVTRPEQTDNFLADDEVTRGSL